MKILSALFLLGVISAVIACFFLPEAGGVIWHLRDGSAADFCGLRLTVPPLYSVNSYPEKHALYMVTSPGTWRSYFKGSRPLKVSLISFHQSVNERIVELPTAKRDSWAAKDYLQTLNKSLKLAGNNGRCFGFSGPPIWRGDNDIEISCEFDHGYQAHFAGTQLGVNDFFRILETAEPVRGKD